MLRLGAKRSFSSSSRVLSDYSHAVIGGGVVGLAVAAELSKNPHNSVILIEKNNRLGQETSSRNSEVIHSGVYYPKDSLKTQLCIEGSQLIYNEARKAGVEMQQCGKWIVAQTDREDAFIESVHYKARDLGIKSELIPTYKGKYIEPAVHAERGILSIPGTGIVSAHSLMDYLHTQLDNNGGEVAVASQVVGLGRNSDNSGYDIEVQSNQHGEHGESVCISVDNVVNAAGLYADKVSNMLLPVARHVKHYYAKGTYLSLNSSFPQVRRLIYPVPPKGVKGLGVHLTLSLDGQIKFGPDVEWVDSPTDYTPSAESLDKSYDLILKYLPHIMKEDFQPTYSGIRPKLVGPDCDEFQDFVIREEDGFQGFVNLLGIESPGLTSSMAIAKYVSRLYS